MTRIVAIIAVLLLAGCRTSGPLASDAAEVSSKGGKAEVVNPSGRCTRDLNQYGVAGNCDCPTGYEYNPRIGKCSLDGRVCGEISAQLIHSALGMCEFAANACAISDMTGHGWRHVNDKDKCDGGGSASAPTGGDITLEAGEYLVRISTPELCSPSPFNVKQTHTYKDANPNKDVTVTLEFDRPISDNWIRTAVCREGENEGFAVVNLRKKFKLNAKGATVASVERVVTSNADVRAARASLGGNKAYIVEMEATGSCNSAIAHFSSSIDFAAATGERANDEVTYERSTALIDNLIRPAICMQDAVDYGFEYVATGDNATTVVAAGAVEGFKVMRIRTITSRTKVAGR